MLRYLLIAAALALPGRICFAQQSAAPSPAAAKFESDLAGVICQDLEKENQKTPLAQLDKPAAQKMLEQVMMRAFMARQKEAGKVYPTNAIDNSEVMRTVGQRVAGRLLNDCPTALKLFMRLSDKAQAIENLDMKVTDAERPLLTTLAGETCTLLSNSNAQKPLRQLPKPERLALVQQAMQQSMKAHATEITALYGAEVFFDTPRLQSVGAKIGLLMATSCTDIVSAFGTE